MDSYRGYKFFLKVAIAYLVASMFLPFGFDSYFLNTNYLFPEDYDGPTESPLHRIWGFYWSFIYIREVELIPTLLPPSMLLPPDQDLVGLSVGLFPEHWGWRPRPRSILFLQAGLIILGFLTIKRAKGARNIVPFFLGILALSVLHCSTLRLDFNTQSYGLWMSILSTIFTAIAITRAP